MYLIFQIVITIGLTIFVVKLARKELDKKMPADQTIKTESINTSSQTESIHSKLSHSNSHSIHEVPAASIPRTRSHSRNMSVNIPPIVDGLTKVNMNVV